MWCKVEPAKAYLFANSIFDGEDWDTKISRDIFLGRFHAWLLSNVGCKSKAFINMNMASEYLCRLCLVYVYREDEILYLRQSEIISAENSIA